MADDVLDISQELRTTLTRRGTNEKPPNPGEVVCHLLRSHAEADTSAEDFWLTRLHSPAQRRHVQRLLGRRQLRAALMKLTRIPSLFVDFHAGMIETIFQLKCDEEIIHGWNQIWDFWSALLDGDVEALGRVDHATIKTLDSRNPRYCPADRNLLQPMFDSGQVFRRFSPDMRHEIWQRLVGRPDLVPTLFSFFHNLKYLKALATCLKTLVTTEYRQTVAKAFDVAFDSGAVQGGAGDGDADGNGDGDGVILPDRNGRAQSNTAYRQLVLFAMRNLEALLPGSLLVDGKKLRDQADHNDFAKHEFALLAHQLGFRSTNIKKQLAKNPFRDAACRMVRLVLDDVPSTVAIDEEGRQTYIQAMADILQRLRRDLRDPRELEAEPVNDVGPEETDRKRRSNCPYRQAHEVSRRLLTWTYMHQTEPETMARLTPAFIRRDIYLFFFGQFEPASISPRAGLPTDITSSPRTTSGSLSRDVYMPRSPVQTDPEGDSRPRALSRGVVEAQTASMIGSSHYSDHDSSYTVSVSRGRAVALLTRWYRI